MEDDQIIDLYWRRDEDAIRQTEAAYGRRLHVLSDRILHSLEDARECVNDTYLNTWRAIPPQRPRHLYGFLAAICRHLSLNRLDWNRAGKRHADVVTLTQELELCVPDRRREDELAGRELGKLLSGFLDTLPRESRLIFLRRYWYADSISQIAARYGMTEGNIKTRLSRTRAKLRTYLEKEGIAV